MFEKILELLASVAIAVAGMVGISVAAGHADPPANDAALNGGKTEAATLKAPLGLSRAESAVAEHASLGPTNGLARAIEALTGAIENAPDQADMGLERAMEAVTESPANDAPAGAAVVPVAAAPGEIPAGPPSELPGGRP